MSESTDQFDRPPADAAQTAQTGQTPGARGQATGAVPPPPGASLRGRWTSPTRRRASGAGGASGETARPAQERQRRQALARLQAQIAGVRASIGRNREQLRDLLAVERTTPLLPAEAGRARALRWEAAQLLHEVSLLRERFEELRGLRGK